MNHIDLGNDASNIITKASMELGINGMKMTGQLAIEVLKLMLEKAKDNQKFASGLMDLEKLIKTGDELQTVKLSSSRLEDFKVRAEQFKIAYAVVPDELNSTIIFKASQVHFINNIMKEFVDKENLEKVAKEQANEIYKLFKDYIDIPEMNENKTLYRHEVELDNNKVKPIKDILEQKGIKSDIAISALDETKATVQFKVPVDQKERTVALVEELKEQELGKLVKLSKELLKIDKEKATKEVKNEEQVKTSNSKENPQKVSKENKENSEPIYKKTAFNNFKSREYDYDKLEKALLGWDKEETKVEEKKPIDQVIAEAKADINKSTGKAMEKVDKILKEEKTLDQIIKEATIEAKERNKAANKPAPSKSKKVEKEKAEVEFE